MRISKQQRQENIQSVFDAVILLSKDRGFDALTMKAIAKQAGIGEATIYNYFPKKDKLITGYLDWSLEKASIKTQQDLSGTESFTDVFHSFIENHIEVLNPGRSFFASSMQALFVSPMSLASTSVAESKQRHKEFLSKYFEVAIERGEFPSPPFRDFLVALMWDYHIGILYYWLKDESEASMKTTELVDLSLQVFTELLRSDLFNKVYAVGHFLFKEHILHKLLQPSGGLSER